jgi:glycosyltransferase involved in cell wall biosynthesis
MRIACISTSRIPSDTANSIQVMKACQGLAASGHEVSLCVPEPGLVQTAETKQARLWDALAEHYGLVKPFEVNWLPSHPRWKRNDFAWKAVARAVERQADLVYTWTGQSAVFGLLRGLPVLYEVHDLPTGKLGPWWFRWFLKLSGRKRLLLITRTLRQRIEETYGALPEEQVVISPNGVDLDQYARLPEPPEARRNLGLSEAVTVLCSGHLYAGRGADLFLGLAERFPQVQFVWVGGRPEDIAETQAKAGAAGLRNLRLTGFVSNRRLPCYQAAADVLLMPYGQQIAGSSGGNSADICSPMKMFDYLATGRAILSSDLPVIHEVLNETNAIFAPPDDLSGWTEALAGLLKDPGLRRRLGDQARQDGASYSWQARAEVALKNFS